MSVWEDDADAERLIPKFVRGDAVVERLGMKPRSLYRLVNAGEIHAYRFGERMVRFRVDENPRLHQRARVEPGTLADGTQPVGKPQTGDD